MEEIEYKVNNIIYKEGDKSEYLYFIKSGKIEISASYDIEGEIQR